MAAVVLSGNTILQYVFDTAPIMEGSCGGFSVVHEEIFELFHRQSHPI
jgi:hypothetical protein